MFPVYNFAALCKIVHMKYASGYFPGLAKCQQISIFAMSVAFTGKYWQIPANIIYNPGFFYNQHLDSMVI